MAILFIVINFLSVSTFDNHPAQEDKSCHQENQNLIHHLGSLKRAPCQSPPPLPTETNPDCTASFQETAHNIEAENL
jgi:hypothetical protein